MPHRSAAGGTLTEPANKAAALTPKQAVSLGALILPIASVRISEEKAEPCPALCPVLPHPMCVAPMWVQTGLLHAYQTPRFHEEFELHLPHTRVLLKERAVQPVALARGWSLWAGAASRGTLHCLCPSACCKNTAQCRKEPSRGNASSAAGVGRTSCSFVGTERTTQP